MQYIIKCSMRCTSCEWVWIIFHKKGELTTCIERWEWAASAELFCRLFLPPTRFGHDDWIIDGFATATQWMFNIIFFVGPPISHFYTIYFPISPSTAPYVWNLFSNTNFIRQKICFRCTEWIIWISCQIHLVQWQH